MDYLKPVMNTLTKTAAIADTIISGGDIVK